MQKIWDKRRGNTEVEDASQQRFESHVLLILLPALEITAYQLTCKSGNLNLQVENLTVDLMAGTHDFNHSHRHLVSSTIAQN